MDKLHLLSKLPLTMVRNQAIYEITKKVIKIQYESKPFNNTQLYESLPFYINPAFAVTAMLVARIY